MPAAVNTLPNARVTSHAPVQRFTPPPMPSISEDHASQSSPLAWLTSAYATGVAASGVAASGVAASGAPPKPHGDSVSSGGAPATPSSAGWDPQRQPLWESAANFAAAFGLDRDAVTADYRRTGGSHVYM